MQIERYFTKSGLDPLSSIEFTKRISEIKNPDGSTVIPRDGDNFHLNIVEPSAFFISEIRCKLIEITDPSPHFVKYRSICISISFE